MSTANNPDPKAGPTLEQWMRSRHGELSAAFLGVAALFAVLPVWQLVLQLRDKNGNIPVGVWGMCLALVFLFGGMYLKLAIPGKDGDERYRILALGMGGAAGLATFLLGILLPLGPDPFGPWSKYFVPVASTPDTSVLKLWRENWWRIGICAFSILGGLALMFVSLQLARSVERASAGMRRLLYGYNAVLTGLLLFAILGLLNVLSYVQIPPFSWFDEQIDWTPSQIYTLSPASRELLKNEVPGSVEVYALMPFSGRVQEDVRTLVKNCKRYKKDIDLKIYSPDANPVEFQKIFQKHGKSLEGDEGLIVIYRDEGGKEESVGIPLRSLRQTGGGEPGGPQRYTFLGENELMKALRKLTEKTPTKIVFTKGHGELELSPSGAPVKRGDGDLATLKQQLQEKRNVEIKEVELGLEGGKLGDADVVVVARPTQEFADKAIAALRDYLTPRGTAKKGKLILLLDTQVRNGKMLNTGLEDLLKEFGVEISNGRILTLSQRPDHVGAFPAERSANPIARAFSAAQTGWLFKQPRKVSPIKGEGSPYQAEPFLYVESRTGVWDESNLTASPGELVNAHFGPGATGKPPQRVRDLPVAVAVSEGKQKPGMPQDRDHAGLKDQVPRLVVIGNAAWVTSEEIARNNSTAGDLFDSCVTWLRGKSDLGEDVAPPKERKEYRLADNKRLKEDPSRLSRIVWLPLGLVFLAVVALGGGIWVVRRR